MTGEEGETCPVRIEGRGACKSPEAIPVSPAYCEMA